ncbi:MAG: hypothetical protein AAF725_17545, partial [Acidobacteriota bacterium]
AAAAPRRELDLEVLAVPFRAAAGLAYVPVLLEIGGDRALAGHEGETLDLEIYLYATSSRGEMRDFSTGTVSLDLRRARAALLAGGVKYYGHLELPAASGEHLLRVLVRNAQTGRAAATSRRLRIPDLSGQRPRLLPPLFLESPGRWLMVREETPNPPEEQVIYPFTVGGEPFVPAALPEIESGEVDLCLMAYGLEGVDSLEIEARVRKAPSTNAREEAPWVDPLAGDRLSGLKRAAGGGLTRWLGRFDASGLEPGDYALEVSIVRQDTGESALSSGPFRVP